MTERPRVLCLDIEGGYGGSSRSLFESVRHIGPGGPAVEVWCRREGPIQARYRDLAVPCRVVLAMPRASSLPRLSRNLYTYGAAALAHRSARPFRTDLVREVNARFDCVHFNHEGLFLLARWLRSHTRVPFTMHIRTNPVPTIFARWQMRTIGRVVDHIVFITENEKKRFLAFGGVPRASSIIHNIVSPPDGAVTPHPDVPDDDRFKLVSLSNYAWVRGLDRLVGVAEALAAQGRRDVLFVMAGSMALTRSLPGELGAVGRAGGTLADYVARMGLAEMFLFLGHVAEPERVLAACHALVRPSRDNNPWGRDVLETMAAGKPVIATGADSTFVENGVTGWLRGEFDAASFAAEIARLADNRALATQLGAAGRARVLELCDGPSRAAELAAVWRGVERP